jgi:hypothetical protein
MTLCKSFCRGDFLVLCGSAAFLRHEILSIDKNAV